MATDDKKDSKASAASATAGTDAPSNNPPSGRPDGQPDKMDTTRDAAAGTIAGRNATGADAPGGIDTSGTDSEIARRARESSASTNASDTERAAQERAAAAAAAPQLLAAAARAVAESAAQADRVESPSIAEQAKKGELPDPVELALKARNASGSGRRLDETIPGGLTVHPDGYFKNAHGQEITAEGEVVEGGNQPRIDLSGARVQPL
jgi:hypothetical protein